MRSKSRIKNIFFGEISPPPVDNSSVGHVLNNNGGEVLMRFKAVLAFGVASMGVFAASPSLGVQFTYEPFNIGANPAAGQYVVGPLAGQNPTNSFFTGAWTDRDPASINDSIQATGLSFLGSPSNGGSVLMTPSATPTRTLAIPWTATTSTTTLPDGVTPNPSGAYYVGYEMSFGAGNYADGTDGNDMGYRSVEFRGTDGSFQFGVAYNAYNGSAGGVNQDPRTGRMVQDGLGAYQIISNSPDNYVADNGVTHLIVLKFVLSAATAADSITLYLDPTNATEPVIPGALVSGADIQLGMISGALFGGTGTFPVLDELRVGTTFADAVPVFPTPGDTNGDMLVNKADYLNILHALNLTGANIPATPTNHPDLNGDGKVNILDYGIWKDHRTDIPSGAGAGAGFNTSGNVPEPTSFILAILAGIGCGLVGRSNLNS